MWNDIRILNFLASTMNMLVITVIVISIFFWILFHPYFSLQSIKVIPISQSEFHYITKNDIQSSLIDVVSGNFFTINLEKTRKVLESVSWVRKVMIYRNWPNSVMIKIEEQQPLALWKKNQMINIWGELFSLKKTDIENNVLKKNLPHLFGPQGTESLVVQRYAEMMRWLSPINLSITELTLSPRYAWHANLSNQIMLDIGRDPGADAINPNELSGTLLFANRIKRFVKFFPLVIPKLEGRKILKADLRYSNGFSLKLSPTYDEHLKNKAYLIQH